MRSNEEFTSIIPSWLQFFTMFLSFADQFVTDPAATLIRPTGHQMVSLCRSVCEEQKAQLSNPLINSWYFPPFGFSSIVSVHIVCFSVGRAE